jgi:hypothetical protein
MLFRCSKNRREEGTHFYYQRHNFHTTGVNVLLKHAQTCSYYDLVAWHHLSRPIISFRELHSQSVYTY